MDRSPPSRRGLAFAAMMISPACFATNLIFGRLAVTEVAPFTLAFLRWLAVVALLAPFAFRHRRAVASVMSSSAPLIILLGALGMWLCGGPVYLALGMTTATNGALIFGTTSVTILLLDAAFGGRRIGLRQALGSALAMFGVVVIVLRGDIDALLHLSFNLGDLILIGCMLGWAVYSIVCRSPRLAPLPNIVLLALGAIAGTVLLAPFAAYEYVAGALMPSTPRAWAGIVGIVIFPSLLAFLTHQYGMRVLGPPVASMFLYLTPAYGVLLALMILGEPFGIPQALGITLVMTGVVLATLPAEMLRRLFGRPA